MKKVSLLLIIFFLIIIVFFTQFPFRPCRVRPIEVKVIESNSKQPIRNAIVYYKLGSVGLKNILGIPIIEPTKSRTISINTFNTDNEGKVNINIGYVFLRLYEKISSEKVCINLDIDLKKITSKSIFSKKKVYEFFRYFNIHDFRNVEFFYNPINSHKGFVIYSTRHSMDVDEQGGTMRKKFNILWNGDDLNSLSEVESFVVELDYQSENIVKNSIRTLQ